MSCDSTSKESSQEPTSPVRIGAGSFATAYAAPGRSIVIKVVHAQEDAAEIEREYNSLRSMYAQSDGDSIFSMPRALAFYDPIPQKLLFPPPTPTNTGGRRRVLPGQHPFNPEFFANLPPRACYVMDRAAPLPSHIGQLIRTKFYAEKAIASGAQVPLVCRLYFGKVLRPSAFVNPNNFPIDVARYDLLWNKYSDDLYTKEEVVEGMGEMLSQIHWKFGYDARDIEFIMAGAPDSMLVRWYVIDFNQMREFDKQSGDISQLVDAFFANDPYYPRPVPNDPLYDIFKQAYMHCCPSQHAARGVLFLQEIEARYAAGHKTE